MNRADLQRLAEERIEDSRALLTVHRWPGAYYLAGYAVECGLKSCILAHIEKTGAIFADRDYVKRLGDSWTHELVTLVRIAGLDAAQGLAHQANPNLKVNWSIAKDWNESSRYQLKTQADAEALFEAITHPDDGVMTWLRTIW